MTHNPDPKNLWQTLAELNLPVSADLDSQVQAWMLVTLCICGVDQEELLNAVLKSASEAISRVENSKDKEVKFPVVHLRVYTSPEIPNKSGSRQNRGFFRMDKHGLTSAGSDPADHLIEFFLYLEGSLSSQTDGAL